MKIHAPSARGRIRAVVEEEWPLFAVDDAGFIDGYVMQDNQTVAVFASFTTGRIGTIPLANLLMVVPTDKEGRETWQRK